MKDYQTLNKEHLQSFINNIYESEGLTQKQIETMRKYEKVLIQNNSKLTTRRHHLQNLRLMFIEIKKDPKNITKEDLEDYIMGLETGENSKKKVYMTHTINERKIVTMLFFSWLYQKPKQDLDLIKWIKVKNDSKYKLPEEILSEEEVKKLVQVGENFRDKALIFTLYESGCRRGEFLGLKLKHITFDDYGAVLIVDGKTGSRRIRIVDCVPDLINWVNSHPNPDDPNAPLWMSIGSYHKNALGSGGLKEIIRKIGLRADIKKKLHPHIFRHSRATILAKNFTEAELRIFFGWSGDSSMPKIYVHLSGQDVENKLLAMKGLLKDEKKNEEKLKAIKCRFCDHKNSAVNKYCANCSRPLRDEDKIALLKKMDEMQKLIDKISSKSLNEDISLKDAAKKLGREAARLKQ